MGWTDYQVTVPVTVHGFDKSAFIQATGGRHAGISVDLRWLGHSDVPRICDQPHCGWDPVGNFNKYFYMKDGVTFLGIKVKEKEEGFPTHPYKFQIGHTYIFKASVQTTPRGNQYRMKVWEKGTPEPTGWTLENLAEYRQRSRLEPRPRRLLPGRPPQRRDLWEYRRRGTAAGEIDGGGGLAAAGEINGAVRVLLPGG